MTETSLSKPTELPQVTVIVPTIGRPLLPIAVRSALEQTYPALDVIVCIDDPMAAEIATTLEDHPRVRVMVSSERVGQGAVRRRAALESTAEYVAFLDDDDRWHPTKIERQIAVAERLSAQGARPVVLCRSNRVTPEGRHLQTVPRLLVRPGQRVADYLLVRRQIRPGAVASMSSMFLLSRTALADLPRLPGSPYLHEDWGLLIGLDEQPDVQIEMVDEVLLDYLVNPIGDSASSALTWRLSAEWFELWRDHLTRREWADGLLCVTAVLAVEQGARRGALGIARIVARSGGAGWRAWAFLALSVAIPKRWREFATVSTEKATARLRRH